MPRPFVRVLITALLTLLPVRCLLSANPEAAPLPAGAQAVWDPSKAYRESTPQTERVCLNGLWRWQPARDLNQAPPTNQWGYFKVPAAWPGINDYMQKDSQRLFPHPDWKSENLSVLKMAWYEREFTIPGDWSDRSISISAEYLNSFAVLFVDGKKAGEMRFPAGEVDITSLCPPGQTHLLSMLVLAMPLKGVMLSYTDSASAREVKGAVARRGLCGDVFLNATRNGPRIGALKIDTSVRHGAITFTVPLTNLINEAAYRLEAQLTDKDREVVKLQSDSFKPADLKDGNFIFTANWKPEKRWDIHTPQNQYAVVLSLHDSSAQLLDKTIPTPFAFREFWIDGRDFYLNGSRIFLSAVPLDNAQIGAAWATYDAAKESLSRLKSFGINFVYTHNYDCLPGSHLSFSEILKAADDVGMLVALTQPHFSHYDWKSPGADRTNGYALHAAFYAHVAGNHPSVIFYSMSHNATGYEQDMNPDMIDGLKEPRDQWALNNSKLALRAEAIVHALDPNRIVYHHASGNLGSMHPMNFYPNFVPIQELSDWFGHWSTVGVKPAFMCEYGAPFTWDWTMYRGWYKGQREFGSAKVPWEFCLAEWNSQFLGDRAFQISEAEKANLRWEARQFRAGNLWHRWDYPVEVGSSRLEERYPIFAMYLTDNWRAFRGWGVSGISPWEYEHFWKLRAGVDRSRKEIPTDWQNLQRPGFSPDYIDQRYERMDLAFERADWIPTPAAQALLRNNAPLLAFIAGKRDAFTSKDHLFHPGDTLEKQILIINNSRETVTATCDWLFVSPKSPQGITETRSRELTVRTVEKAAVDVRIPLPSDLAPNKYELSTRIQFSNGETQTDSFTIDLLPEPSVKNSVARIALFDNGGETEAWLRRHQIQFQLVSTNSDLTRFDTLIIGKRALVMDSPVPDVHRVRDGLKVIIFEQTAEVLEKRFGFRVEQYGLRQAFPRIPDHPLLAGLTTEQLRDWHGEATLLPSRLQYTLRPRYGPTVEWCGMSVPHIWRCGNRGNVASVLIEKPARGNFLPIIDGGFSLQYSPLMEYREGKGMSLFCQMDVTGRTESDPAADTLACNILNYVASWKPAPTRKLLYAGEPEGETFLKSIGIESAPYTGGKLEENDLMVVAPGANLNANKSEIADWLRTGGSLLALGLNEKEANAFLPFAITTKEAEHIAAWFEPPAAKSLFAGVSPADVHNRDPRKLHLITGGAKLVGDGILAEAEGARVIFCQFVPWQFQGDTQNLKKTRRHASFLVSRLLANLGAAETTPLLDRFGTPTAPDEKRYLTGFYLDQPEEWDDPYRFFRW